MNFSNDIRKEEKRAPQIDTIKDLKEKSKITALVLACSLEVEGAASWLGQ